MRNAQRGSLRIIGDQLHDYSCFHYPYIQFPTVPQVHLVINVVWRHMMSIFELIQEQNVNALMLSSHSQNAG